MRKASRSKGWSGLCTAHGDELAAAITAGEIAHSKPPCLECGAMSLEEAEKKYKCGGDKDDCPDANCGRTKFGGWWLRKDDMNKLSLKPDADMAWIYDCYHPDYNSEQAKDLRERRRFALASCPQWMIDEARMNDLLDIRVPNV